MNTGKIVFSQVMDFLPLHEFHKCVERYQGDYKIKRFSCLDQFLCLAFAQLTYRESLRAIEACLQAMSNKLYHMGIRSQIFRTTLAKANENRDWRIYADFAQILIRQARKLYIDDKFAVDLGHTAYALDSTIIDLCLSIFPWARWTKHQGAVKIHTLLNLKGNIPSFVKVTKALVSDFEIIDDIILEPGAFYIMDRGYLDLSRLYSINLNKAFFIIREKKKINFQRLYSHPVDKSTNIRSDQTIIFTGRFSEPDYPENLRRIRYFHEEDKKYYTFHTNNFLLPALTIAQLYKCRWQVELFFRWIKQHLRIKSFYGTSENAVKTQIWIAISIYILVAIIKKRLNIKHNLYTLLQVLSISSFEKKPLIDLLTNPEQIIKAQMPKEVQLTLFDN